MAKKILFIVLVLAVAGSVWYFWNRGGDMGSDAKKAKQIDINNNPKPPATETKPANRENVSPISGLPCPDWKRRPVAVMQPADVSARPAAGFSEADMVFEMPVFTGSNTRLMGVYLCNVPVDIGSMRSARHDYIPLAKSLDAVFIHWGYSKFAETLLKRGVIDNIDCLTTSYCPRWPQTGKMKYEDTGHITRESISQAFDKYQYRKEGTFVGYPHQDEVAEGSRPKGGHLRVAFPSPYDVSYDYDPATNTYLRTWDTTADTDKNNGARIAPKNVVVMYAQSEQIKLSTDYKARGVQDPWELVPEEDRAGLNDIPGAPGIGRYNNLEMGDPWFDTKESGDAYFYMNGTQIHGSWRKDKSRLESKLTFFDASGSEIKFVPGQIWVDVLEPGEAMKWEPVQ